MEKCPAVYILASKTHSTLYVGVTSNLAGRVWQHKHGRSDYSREADKALEARLENQDD